MNDGAIDFRKLLKEEKKKARRKQQQQQQQQRPVEKPENSHGHGAAQPPQPQPKNGNDNTQTPINIVDQNYTIREEDVEAIDFQKLRQAEKERSLRRQQEQSMAESWCIPTDSFDRTNQLVCSKPPTIHYVANFLPLAHDQQALMEWLQSLPDNPRGTSLQQPNENTKNQSHNGAWTTMHYAKRRVALFDATAVATSNSIATTEAAQVTGSNANQNDNDNHNSNKINDNYSDKATHDFPAPLQRLVDAFVAQGIFPPEQAPNHILINEYHPGQGILPHTDGPAYVSRTATLSLGSDVLIQFTPRPNYKYDNDTTADTSSDETTPQQQQQQQQHHQLWLEKGSLLVFEDSAYLDYCHGIADRVLEETVSKDCLNAPSNTSTIQRGYRISLTFRHKHSSTTNEK